MAPRKKKPTYHHVDPPSGFIVPKENRFFDFDYPLDTNASFNSNTGVKRLGKKDRDASGFGRLRIFMKGGPVVNTRRPADGLETKDSLAWAAALHNLKEEATASNGWVNPAGRRQREIKTQSLAGSTLSLPLSTASTTNSSAIPSTDATSVSAVSGKKRKAEEPEPNLPRYEEKKRRIERLVCKHGIVQAKGGITDVDMCDCDDFTHTVE